MVFWIISLLMCAASIMLVLIPLARNQSDKETDETGLDFYQAQLADVEKRIEEKRGVPAVLEEERIEIARRILKSNRENSGSGIGLKSVRLSRTIAAVVAIGVIPALSYSIYNSAGTAGTPDVPLASQKAAQLKDQSVDQLVQRAESHLADNPDDPRGWEILARVYQRLNRQDDRAKALRQLIRLKGPSADRFADLAESIAITQQNVISAQAKSILQQALQQNPQHRKARFYFALALEQEGNFIEAKGLWEQLAKLNPENVQWQSMIKERLDVANRGAGIITERGPTKEDVKAAAALSENERQSMIEGMVANLAERLKEEPNDFQGWQRLINAYVVLKQDDKAISAADRAAEHFSDQPEALAKLTELRTKLNLPERKSQ